MPGILLLIALPVLPAGSHVMKVCTDEQIPRADIASTFRFPDEPLLFAQESGQATESETVAEPGPEYGA